MKKDNIKDNYLIEDDKVKGKYIDDGLKFPYKYDNKYSSWINVSKEYTFTYIRRLEKEGKNQNY